MCVCVCVRERERKVGVGWSGSAIQENVAGGGAQVRPQVQVLYFGFEILGKFP